MGQAQKTVELLRMDYSQKRGDVLGTGGFGTVYSLVDCDFVCQYNHENDFKVKKMNLAVKEINVSKINQELDSDKMVKYAQKEIELMTSLNNHPNIIDILGSFESVNPYHERIIHVIMKQFQFDGQRFHNHLKRDYLDGIDSEFPEKKTVESIIFLLEVAKGLQYIHSFGLIHFDIKLQNILLNWKDGKISELCITDFGSCKHSNLDYVTTLPSVSRKFAAPEVLKLIDESTEDVVVGSDLKLSNKCDIYQFGLLIRRFREFCEGYPCIQTLEQKCLSENPNDRPSLFESIYLLKLSLETIFRKLLRSCKMNEFLSEIEGEKEEEEEEDEEDEGEEDEEEEVEEEKGGKCVTICRSFEAMKIMKKLITKLKNERNSDSLPPQINGPRFAFLVGQNQGQLVCSVNDATKMSHELQMSFGYDCTLKTDIRLNEFESSFQTFLKKVEDEDVSSDQVKRIFLYFAGHGYEDDGKLYLMCLGRRHMKLDKLLRALNRLKSRVHVTVAIDASRDEESNQVWKGKVGGGDINAPQVSNFQKSFILGFSCASGRSSEANKNPNGLSLYTSELLASMRSKKDKTIMEIMTCAGDRLNSLNEVRGKKHDHQQAWVNFTAKMITFQMKL